MSLHPSLVAERQRRLEALGPCPPWWRLFARRSWERRRASIMAMDVSWAMVMLRNVYGADLAKEMAERRNPLLSMLTKAKR